MIIDDSKNDKVNDDKKEKIMSLNEIITFNTEDENKNKILIIMGNFNQYI